jgi:iron complex outermembrane receptor protein
MKKTLLLLCCVCTLSVQAQNKISGTVLHVESQEPVNDALIKLLKNKLVLESSRSQERGDFSFASVDGTFDSISIEKIGFERLVVSASEAKKLDFKFVITPKWLQLETAVIKAIRSGNNSPGTFTNIDKAEIAKSNLGQDLPFLLNQLPGVVVNSDAGAGIGYTGIRIRGVDPTRINVTINGIPVNDGESQGVFWVNMPDFASSVESIQVQRGVGTSTNGSASFGAGINILTGKLDQKPYVHLDNSIGSFNTIKNTLKFGTGLLHNKLVFEGRLSNIQSDGFIDRASANLQAYYLSAAWFEDKTVIKANVFGGKERTYQAWYGVPKPRFEGNIAGMNHYADYLYWENSERENLLSSKNNTYNYYAYPDQVDNYNQNHYQLHISRLLQPNFDVNVSLHYTNGYGYFEEYVKNQSFADYKLTEVVIGNDTLNQTDMVRRRWLDNDFYGIVFSANYQRIKNLELSLGGALNQYDGRHFGEIVWARFASNSAKNQRYYENVAAKTDGNLYLKSSYTINKKLTALLDLQYRQIHYAFVGPDHNNFQINQAVDFGFFNPKAGLLFKVTQNQNLSLWYSRSNREPVRDDFVSSTPLSRPKAELLDDIELNYVYDLKRFRFQATAYHMAYKDQLVLTGKVNDVGAYTRVNVPESYRSGLEFSLTLPMGKHLIWSGNLALSENKLRTFTEYIDNWDDYTQISNTYNNSTLAFSPAQVLSSVFRFSWLKYFETDLISKYVSRQYLDNTQNQSRSLNPFFVQDLRISFQPKISSRPDLLSVNLLLNNLFNQSYAPNGYTFSGIISGERNDFTFLYPQAGTNFLLQVSIKF